MKQAAIHDYLYKYFKSNNCEILENHHSQLKVKLTVDLDKLLMNRPFYWHYMEKINQQPETAVLTFKTDPKDEGDGEFIHFGSPRLHQIFQSAQQLAPFIRLFHIVPALENKSIALKPWLGLNIKVSYQCDVKKDRILSLGLQLINGTLIDQFQSLLESLPLTPKIPDYCYTLQPLIRPLSGIRRIESYLVTMLKGETHDWASDAIRRWEHDLHLLDQFYDEEEKPETYHSEKEALKSQYEPKIHVQFINGGLFYLHDSAFS
ncbi:hypothetical protein GMB86_11665 [Terrilactibacillus sp. BCM23-1]|uniref:YqhG family protein n=1 Tax=Terrilactibacillus tamarindi TaxID=2599694 RepID=A0A6N8CU67_9BACI|nr:YqhG family protein [Terrilactibacillus tamarindi]MTT32663.1 hypothetical protein [Terrilactibacillus tamarindi]